MFFDGDYAIGRSLAETFEVETLDELRQRLFPRLLFIVCNAAEFSRIQGAFFFFFAMLSLISGVDQCADKQSLFCKRSLPLPRQLADARPLISFDARLQRMARADAQVGQ